MPRVVAEGADLEALRSVLPEIDVKFWGRAYATCSVVGSATSLLRGDPGTSIDEASLVFRADDAPSGAQTTKASPGPSSPFGLVAGNRTDVRVTSLARWGWRETETETVVVEARSERAARGLVRLQAGRRADKHAPGTVSLDPGFQTWLDASLRIRPDAELTALFLALHVCRQVRAFGMVDVDALAADEDATGAQPPERTTTHGSIASSQAAATGAAPALPTRYYESCPPPTPGGRPLPLPNELPGAASPATRAELLWALWDLGLIELPERCAPECAGTARDGGKSCRVCRSADDRPTAPVLQPPCPGGGGVQPLWRDPQDTVLFE